MIHKSFLRDKKTKIYIIIFSFIFSIFLIITIGRREFLIEYNHNYENSFLYLEDSKSWNLWFYNKWLLWHWRNNYKSIH